MSTPFAGAAKSLFRRVSLLRPGPLLRSARTALPGAALILALASCVAAPVLAEDGLVRVASNARDVASGPVVHAMEWFGAWSAPPVPPQPVVEKGRLEKLKTLLIGEHEALPEDSTVRSIVTLTAGGNFLRVRLTNYYGTVPLEIGGASVAPGANPMKLAPGSLRRITFGGSPSVTIPPGASILSDPVAMTLGADAPVAISLYLPGKLPPVPSRHSPTTKPSVVVPGNAIGMTEIADVETRPWVFFISGVDVAGGSTHQSIAVLGDSLTDGGDGRWPFLLARRLEAAGIPTGVLNQGIAGNRIASDGGAIFPASGPPALSRFDRDVLGQSGVRHLIVFEGINDLGGSQDGDMTAAELISYYEQIIARAHENNIKVHFMTITPFLNAAYPGYGSPAKEKVRQDVNAWIRSDPRIDSVIDTARIVADPADPTRLNPVYDVGDHLHLNGDGQSAVADAIPLAPFDGGAQSNVVRSDGE